MTITLQIQPELEAELSRQAQAEGLRVEAYIEGLIAKAAARPGEATATAQNMVELFSPLRGLNLDFERDRDAGRPLDI
jgi:hypothetical protein